MNKDDQHYNNKIYSLIVFKTAKYYGMDLEIENLDNSSAIIHPKIEFYKEYLKKFININELEAFYKKIISNCQYFPSGNDLSEIYKAFSKKNEILSKQALMITKGDAVKAIAERDNIPYECTDKYKDASFDQMKRDNETITSHEMLKRYGMKKTTSFWRQLGSSRTLEEYELSLKKWQQKSGNVNVMKRPDMVTNPEYFMD